METKDQQKEQTEEQPLSHKDIGRILRSLRRKRGMSQRDLAEIIPFSQPTIHRYELSSTLDDEILEQFAKAYKMSLEELKNYEVDEEINITIENTFQENSKNEGSIIGKVDSNTSYIYPIEKVIELYETLVKAEREISNSKDKLIDELTQQIEELKKPIKDSKKK